jgi:cytochrome b561
MREAVRIAPPAIRYSTVAIVLHWAIAALILLNIAVGFVMEGLSPPLKAAVVALHFSCGMTVLALTVLRLLWRLTHRPPPLSAGCAPGSGWRPAAPIPSFTCR